jgi:hypothetical protein
MQAKGKPSMNAKSSDTTSRYEINRLVRGILTRHGIDLEGLALSSSASLVYLNGFLKRFAGTDLAPTDIDLIFREIEQIPMVHGIIADLDNWVVTGSDGAWVITPKGRSRRPTAPLADREDYRIKKEERLADVLENIRKRHENDERK